MSGGPKKDVVPEPRDAVAGSGIRYERETTPAPPTSSEDEWDASFPSARPTSVPDYDVAAFALAASLPQDVLSSVSKLPLDIAVPTRTPRSPGDLDLRASFLLLHVDGHSSVRDIAAMTGIPIEEVLVALLGLTASGLVDIGSTMRVTDAPQSGARPVKKDEP
jgi:hypothetical protein